MGPILLADARNPELRAALHALRGDLELIEADAVPEALRRCTIWLGEPDRLVPLLRAGLRPQWLQSTWAGYRPLLAADLRVRGHAYGRSAVTSRLSVETPCGACRG